MSPITRFHVLRFFERLLLLGSLAWLGALVYFFADTKLNDEELVAGSGVLLLILVIRTYIQHKIDQHVVVAYSQNTYGHDAAFSALFERSPVAYLIIGTNGEVFESNQAAVKLLQTDIETIVGADFLNCLNEAETVDLSVLREKVKAGMTLYDLEVPLTTFSGEVVWVMLSSFAYRSSGKRLISLVDVTEQKHIDTAKSEFVALATHQLRTPIAAIRWNAELLQKSLVDSASEAQGRYLTKILRNTLRMNDLIDDFLSASKLEMGTYATKAEAVELTDFLSGVLDEFSGKIAEKQIALDRSESSPHVTIKIDCRLLHIIFSNLISNAVKYLGVRGKLQVKVGLEGDSLTFEVTDNGIGVPEDEVDRLFTKFYRASNAQSHQTEGTGLGLYIVQQSVDLLEGKIEVESKENEGTSFTVVLPVQVVSRGEGS